MPFPALQGLFDGLLPSDLQWYWKANFVDEFAVEFVSPTMRTLR
jgi:hypothetical protein